MDLSRNARNDDGMQAASNFNQIEGAAMDNAVQDPAVDDNMPAELLAAFPHENDNALCESFLDMLLTCDKENCRLRNGIDPCGVLRFFFEHYKICEDCLAVYLIHHAVICRDAGTCKSILCNNIREKLKTFSVDRCLHIAVAILQRKLYTEQNSNDFKLLIEQLMKLDCQTDDENVPPSGRRRITGTEAAEYWLHFNECDDDNCEFKTDSTSCEEKIEALELRIYCTINCTECQLFEQFVNRHAQKCQLGSCPIPGCNEIRNIDEMDSTTSDTSSDDY